MSDKAMKPKSRLGRGLSSLISISTPDDPPAQLPAVPATDGSSAVADTPSDASDARQPGVRVAEIPLAAIVANPHQPRRHFNEATLKELAASLKATGMIQPIIVRPAGADRYELIAGERRWRAARLAELETVPAILRDVDSATQAQMALIENIQREDLNPMDRALAYQALIKHLGLTQAELAGRLGEDRSTITHYLRLLEMPESVQQLIGDGRLSMAHAKILSGVTEPAEQQRLANLVVEQNLSVRNLERIVQEAAPAPEAPKPERPAPSAHLQDLERSLAHQLSLRVQIRPSNRKGHGRLVLHYTSLDQFDELLSRMGVRVD
jgi:ParB family chromosome partitioning protein